jgi:hypothetical protein
MGCNECSGSLKGHEEDKSGLGLLEMGRGRN